MSAGTSFEYLWADTSAKKPIKVSAPEYVDRLMTWIEFMLSNEKIFPTSVDVPFPDNFEEQVKRIMKRLFRVYAHVYYNHFREVTAMDAEAHLNTCFKV
jgi:MOB kinase activator 1